MAKNPVKIRKLRSGGWRVIHDGQVSARRTTKRKAEAQARLLRGVDHGLIPRRGNPRRSPGYVIMFGGPDRRAQAIYTVPEALRLLKHRPELYQGNFSRTFNSLTVARREAARHNKTARGPVSRLRNVSPRRNHRDPLLGPKRIRNPHGDRVKIYDRVIEVVARKGPGHHCDAECARANHTYIHKFGRRKSGVWGEPDGSLLIQ